MMKRWIVVGVIVFSTPLAVAQMPMHDDHSSMPGCPMQKQHGGSDQKPTAMNSKLQSALTEMNRGTGTKRIDAMAALLNELVAERMMGCDMKPASAIGSSDRSMPDCPMMKEQESAVPSGAAHAEVHHDHAAMETHGGGMMGLDQSKTTHRFFLYNDGGAIELSVNDPADKTDLDAVRKHLADITTMFSSGDFSIPASVHGREVPGTAAMAQRKDRIAYAYSETATGGRVTITTTDSEALAAVHAFLTFQITRHKTGDSLQPKARQ